MQAPTPGVGVHPALANGIPQATQDTAHRISIRALVGSPQPPRRISGIPNTTSLPCDKLLEHPPAMTDGAQASIGPKALASGQWGFSNRPHPVKQLQGALSKGRRNKKHICEFAGCGREFSRKSNLEAHSRKHMTGAQATPYACQHCTRRFKWRSSLKSHEAGCMHQSLPNAIQQQQRLEQRRLEQHRQYLDEQEKLKIERRKAQVVAERWPQGARQAQRPPQTTTRNLAPNPSPLIAAAQAAVAIASPVSAVQNPEVSNGKVLQDTSLREQLPSVVYGVETHPGSSAKDTHQLNIPASVKETKALDQGGMLTSLRLPPLGLSANPAP